MIKGKCAACRKTKWFIRKRSYKIPQFSDPITSDGALCTSCYKLIKKLTLNQ